MKNSKHLAAIAAFSALIASGALGVAQAQAPTAAPPTAASPDTSPNAGKDRVKHGGHHHKWGAKSEAERAQYFQKRMDELHAKLGLTSSQEGAWRTFVEQSKPAAKGPRPDRAAFAAMRTPEKMDKMLEMQRQRLARATERAAAVKRFYAQLTPTQQKAFDDSFRMHHRGGQKHGAPTEQPG